MYIYINGNLKRKMPFSNNTPAYQNFGNVYLFSTRKVTLSKNITMSLERDPELLLLQGNSGVNFNGAAKGQVSRVYYFGYALTYTEIQTLINMGPAPVTILNDLDAKLSDTWWVNNQGP
jgi:hypothetical protein